jgi:hypothetical protein
MALVAVIVFLDAAREDDDPERKQSQINSFSWHVERLNRLYNKCWVLCANEF